MIRNNIVLYVTTLAGALLVLSGIIGFCFPHFLGLQLNPLINLVHLASGFMALYLGLKSTSLVAARNYCLILGTFYTLVGLAGVAGFVVGGLGNSLVHLVAGVSIIVAAAIQPVRSTIYSSRS